MKWEKKRQREREDKLQASSWPAEEDMLRLGATDVLGATRIADRERAERTIAVAILRSLLSLKVLLCEKRYCDSQNQTSLRT